MSQQSIHDRIMSRAGAGTAEELILETENRPKKGWLRIMLISIFGVATVLGAGFAVLQFPAVQNVFAQDTSVEAASKSLPALPETPFLDHAKKAGLTTCGRVFPMLGQLLGNGAQYNVQTDWDGTEPNKHSVQALVGLNYASQSYSGPAAGIVFASPVGSACEGGMVRIAPFPKKCQDVPAGFPQGSTPAPNLGQVSVYNLASDGGQVLLIPSGESCVVVSVARGAG